MDRRPAYGLRAARWLIPVILAGAGVLVACMPITSAPTPEIGYSDVRIVATTEQPAPGDGTGAFRTVCGVSKVAYDDPIVYPGQPGKSHLHLFFGNTGIDANSTNESLRASGNSTCRGGIVNRSAYWIPAVIDSSTGESLTPIAANFYYKTGYGGVAPASVTVPPPGLRMIAGYAGTSTPVDDHTYFGCVHRYIGHLQAFPTECGPDDDINLQVVFPQCWDGTNLDSPDHHAHMAYPTGNGCPATHPVPIPELTISVDFDVTPTTNVANWKLSSDMYDGPGGYSLHGDWMNGWDPDVMTTWVTNCDNKAVDCHSHLLGDGRMIY